MSKVGRGAAKAHAKTAAAESALERTQKALEAAERVDRAAAGAKRGSHKFVKFLLLLTVAGVAAMLVRKVLGGASTPASSPAPRSASTPSIPAASSPAASSPSAAAGGTSSSSARNGDQPDAPAVRAESVGEDPTA